MYKNDKGFYLPKWLLIICIIIVLASAIYWYIIKDNIGRTVHEVCTKKEVAEIKGIRCKKIIDYR
jgi:branched-subunit amino acid ABC-type transport system permease component